jgi:glycyl-tRNA synthetase
MVTRHVAHRRNLRRRSRADAPRSRLAPIRAVVFPLVNKDGVPEIAEKIRVELAKRFAKVGFIRGGRQGHHRQALRADGRSGLPLLLHRDGDTLKDQTVTVRDRDTGQQESLAAERLPAYLGDKLGL